jgi:protein FAM50
MSAAQSLEVIRGFESGNDIRQIVSCSEGGRALRLLKRREETKARAEQAKQEIENETKKRKFASLSTGFGGNSQADYLEEEFKKQTVGLVSAEEFKAKRQAIDEIIQAQGKSGKDTKMRLKRSVQKKTLSFQDDEDADELDGLDSDGDDDDKPNIRTSFGKDPSVNTSFLYDADREAEIQRKKQDLIKEYHTDQNQQKNQQLEVTYSYWDGSGHRRSCVVEKGHTIGQFLAKSKKELEKTDFPELRTTTLDSLLYVKEDLILPHNITFYDLIKDKARGTSGPLFNFGVHEDIRMSNDSRIEKDESHAGKIVDRKWYERNKHIFPACRWEAYSKDKTYDQYTVAGVADLSKPLISTLKG